MKVCDETGIFCFFPIINKYRCMAKRSLLSGRPTYVCIYIYVYIYIYMYGCLSLWEMKGENAFQWRFQTTKKFRLKSRISLKAKSKLRNSNTWSTFFVRNNDSPAVHQPCDLIAHVTCPHVSSQGSVSTGVLEQPKFKKNNHYILEMSY